MGVWKGTDFDKTCGDCIHADICEHNPSLEFSRENIAWCDSFKDKADVVEVVRCKDCVYGRPYGDQEEYIMCEDSWDLAHPRNHFCSYGKRKDGLGGGSEG